MSGFKHETGRWTVLGAPTNLGLSEPAPGRQPGTRRAPIALRDAGLVDALGAADAGDVPAPAYTGVRDDTGTRHGRAIAAYAKALADQVGALLERGERPFVVGGDCSVLLGGLLALRRRGSARLIFVDGHLDFRQPPAPLGAAAGEELAIAVGRGHAALADLEGLGPLVRPDEVVAIGNREHDDDSAAIAGTQVLVLDRDAVRRRGPVRIAQDALERCGDAPLWLHVDADVLDSALMPAVDSPQPDGLSYAELEELLAVLMAGPSLAGCELTIFDPDLDPGGRHARAIVEMVRSAARA